MNESVLARLSVRACQCQSKARRLSAPVAGQLCRPAPMSIRSAAMTKNYEGPCEAEARRSPSWARHVIRTFFVVALKVSEAANPSKAKD